MAAAAFVVVLVGLHLTGDFVVLIAFSVLATLLVVPLQQSLRRRGLGNGVATLLGLTVYVVVLVAAGLAGLFGAPRWWPHILGLIAVPVL